MLRHPSHAEEGSIARRLVDDMDPEAPRQESILFMDEPDHSRVRLPLAKAFYARVNKMKDVLEGIVDDVIASAPPEGRFDLMADIAVPVPILVIARILGVDEARVADFRAWSEAVILSLNPLRSAEETSLMEWGGEQLEIYFTELIEARRQQPEDDLISDMVALQASGEAGLSDAELRVNLQALLIGGNLTTTDLIGNGVWLLLTHPDQLRALRADPSLSRSVVEEVLRFESPVAVTSRILPEDRVHAGCPMKHRQSVWVSLHSANRDAEKFDTPDVFDITLDRQSHVAFGGGSHICIGAPLARIEARRVFAHLFQRYPNMTLPEQELSWRTLPFFRGLETLWVEV
jgi:cytochrome P450